MMLVEQTRYQCTAVSCLQRSELGPRRGNAQCSKTVGAWVGFLPPHTSSTTASLLYLVAAWYCLGGFRLTHLLGTGTPQGQLTAAANPCQSQ